LVGGGQLVEAGLVHQEDRRAVDVAGQAQVLLHLVELGRHDHRQRILLPVHRALLHEPIPESTPTSARRKGSAASAGAGFMDPRSSLAWLTV
jgi:hypothetical protein